MKPARPLREVGEGTLEVPRTARYFTLGDHGGETKELWIVLHGFGQLARDFVQYFADLDDGTRLVIAPEALNRYYTVASTTAPASERPVGATWMTREDRENEIKDYVRYLDLVASRFTRVHPSARVIVVGFSQGGATAARWAQLGHTAIDRVILWGATVPPDTDLTAGPTSFRGSRLTLVIGQKDQYITPAALAAEKDRLGAAGVRFDVVEYDGGHSIKRAVLATLT